MPAPSWPAWRANDIIPAAVPEGPKRELPGELRVVSRANSPGACFHRGEPPVPALIGARLGARCLEAVAAELTDSLRLDR